MALEKSSTEMLAKFFQTISRNTFSQLRMGDSQIADYIASMLTDFSRADRLFQLRAEDGRKLSSVVEVLIANLGPETRARIINERAIRKYVGDYTLFMSGLFRGYVEHGGYLDYYLKEGRKSYRAVSRLDHSLFRPGFMIFEELSERFENYSGALDFMRKCYFPASAGASSPFAGFLRQVESILGAARSNN